MLASEWTNRNQGTTAGYNYDPSQENVDEDIYAGMDMDQMDDELPEGPQNYFQDDDQQMQMTPEDHDGQYLDHQQLLQQQ